MVNLSWKDPFGEPWEKRTARYRQQSPFKHNENWGMQSVIFKSGEICVRNKWQCNI